MGFQPGQGLVSYEEFRSLGGGISDRKTLGNFQTREMIIFIKFEMVGLVPPFWLLGCFVDKRGNSRMPLSCMGHFRLS